MVSAELAIASEQIYALNSDKCKTFPATVLR
jgi:hypothetical protein